MTRHSNRLTLFCLILYMWIAVCPPVFGAENLTSPLNGMILECSDTPQEYSFLVAGHVYGAPQSPSVFPSASFLANLNEVNKIDAKFLILLGDNYRSATPRHIENFKASICSNIGIPLFNAVGNHDVTNRELYVGHFGPTYYDFRHGSELFIILDSELNNGEIVNEQLEYLKTILKFATNAEDIENVFIFSHKLIWSVENGDLQIVYERLNSQSGYANNNNFKTFVMPEIIRLSQRKNVFLISGDIGCSWSLPLFYHQDAEEHNITYVACGLGDTEKDAIIKVDITRKGGVTFTPISLTSEKLEVMSHYGIKYWSSYFSETERSTKDMQHLILGKIQRLLTNLYFYLGIVFSFILMSGFILLNRFRKQ